MQSVFVRVVAEVHRYLFNRLCVKVLQSIRELLVCTPLDSLRTQKDYIIGYIEERASRALTVAASQHHIPFGFTNPW